MSALFCAFASEKLEEKEYSGVTHRYATGAAECPVVAVAHGAVALHLAHCAVVAVAHGAVALNLS